MHAKTISFSFKFTCREKCSPDQKLFPPLPVPVHDRNVPQHSPLKVLKHFELYRVWNLDPVSEAWVHVYLLVVFCLCVPDPISNTERQSHYKAREEASRWMLQNGSFSLKLFTFPQEQYSHSSCSLRLHVFSYLYVRLEIWMLLTGSICNCPKIGWQCGKILSKMFHMYKKKWLL